MVSIPDRIEALEDVIEAEVKAHCPACGSIGLPFYRDLADRFFGAPGRWNFSRCSDSRCGMLWLNPMPLARDINKAYRSYYTHEDRAAPTSRSFVTRAFRPMLQAIKRAYLAAQLGYTDRRIGVHERLLGLLVRLDPIRRADTDFPLKYLPYDSRGRLLDVGCGSGDLLARMESLGWEAQGIDLDPIAVAAARRKGLEVHRGALDRRNFPDAHFDAVVMSHLIEHVHQPIELLAHARRVLRPGGRLVIATPNAESLGHRMLRERWPLLDPPRHLQIFTPPVLESMARKAGFADVRVSTEVRTGAAMFALAIPRRLSAPRMSSLASRA
ncbi:MAG TPA: class I SAM-dependent methyltransferase, partial [Candidatus Binataceae bacterium]|nr:class I SAM-dependent methyltransferase [Candidatus Binataceae bacterium]